MLRFGAVFVAASGDHDDVAARTEAAPFGVIDNHDLDGGVLPPFEQRRAHNLTHLGVQRMDGLWPVEPNPPDAAFDGNQDIVSHWRSMSRLTMTRMTWLVPSRIEWTRRSRQKRSI